jgi:hypothetical protein
LVCRALKLKYTPAIQARLTCSVFNDIILSQPTVLYGLE